MYKRLLSLPQDHHFFLFGARNTGKSTLLGAQFNGAKSAWFDLLDEDLLAELERRPNRFYEMVKALPENIRYVVIDEVQKIPALLNVIHRLMKDKKRIFLMTGSSARKLKRQGVNLLAGRAFVYHLYPLTYLELGKQFSLTDVLQWGSLPEVFSLTDMMHKQEFLKAYTHTYLKEEIAHEQLIRNLAPFRRFLEVAAQCNGKIINYANIARDVGVDDKTVKNYFSILEDTLVGINLDAYHGSLRKRISQNPKFYFFDGGVTRALAATLALPLRESTHAYGDAFEAYIVNECTRLAKYYRLEYKFSYLRDINDHEIDLIIERPGQKTVLVEIKSAITLAARQLNSFNKACKLFKDSELLCLSRAAYAYKIENVMVMPWQQGLEYVFKPQADHPK